MTRPVRLTVPATGAWVVLVRTTATAVCARLGFDVDTLEDVRLAVDEVATMLVAGAEEGAHLSCELLPEADGTLIVTLSAPTRTRTLPERDTFAWAVLSALVDDVTMAVADDRATVVLRAARGPVGV